MNEKEAIKKLRMIETEMAYLEKRIRRQKKILSSFSRGYLLRLLAMIAAILIVGMAAPFYLNIVGHMDTFEPMCLISFFLFVIIFVSIVSLIFKDEYEEEMIEITRGMGCWLEYYKKEKERLVSEHPELRRENIGPYRIHYWDLYTYYMAFGTILLLLLNIVFPWNSYPTTLFLYVLILMGLAANYVYKKHYQRCPEHD